MPLQFSVLIDGSLKIFSVVLYIPETREILKKDHMCSWLLPPSLYLKQIYSVHYVANSLWSCQRSLMKMALSLLLSFTLSCLLFLSLSLFFSSFLLSFPFSLFFLTLLSHPFLLCGLSWPCHFTNFKENFFSLCPLENVAVQLGLRYWCYFEVRSTNALGDKKKRSHEGNMYLFRLSDYWG